LPLILRWFNANIGVHHVRHMCSRIPYYRPARVLRGHPQPKDVSRITLAQSVRCIRFALWDEDRGRMITFRQLRTLRRSATQQRFGDGCAS
jgi:omega-6 fatty acid desaturase (delta-12 desaturase)